MILNALREEVLEANLELVRRGLVLYTFGNASGISRDEGLVVIKPSGVPYDKMKPEDLVVTDLHGKIVEGSLRPSSDLPTHLILYREFAAIGGIAHTHSRAATSWAQAQREIPCFGTTHADYFHGPIPVTKPLRPAALREARSDACARRARCWTRSVLLGHHAFRSRAHRGHRRRNCRHGIPDDCRQSEGTLHLLASPRQAFSPQTWPRRLLRTE